MEVRTKVKAAFARPFHLKLASLLWNCNAFRWWSCNLGMFVDSVKCGIAIVAEVTDGTHIKVIGGLPMTVNRSIARVSELFPRR